MLDEDRLNEGRLFVVDDDEAVLMSIRALLLAARLRPECFSSAEEFLAQSEDVPTGCVLTDLQMPDVNGLELQRRLAARNSCLSVVVITGMADSETGRLVESGAILLLEKPFTPVGLVAVVQQALELSRRRWQARSSGGDTPASACS